MTVGMRYTSAKQRWLFDATFYRVCHPPQLMGKPRGKCDPFVCS